MSDDNQLTPEEQAALDAQRNAAPEPAEEPAAAAPQEGAEAPEGEAAGQAQPEPDKRPQMVPHAALHEERERRKQAEARAAETERRSEERMRMLLEKLGPQPDTTPAPQIPAVDQDPVGHIVGNIADIRGQVQNLAQATAAQQEQAQRAQAVQALQQQALAHRPDLQGCVARLEGAQATQRLATYALFPDLNLGLASQKIRGEGDFWKAGLSLSVPLWAWGKQRGEISGARAEVARARAEQGTARNQILLEVQQAHLEVETAQQQVRYYRERVLPNAEEAYRYVRRRYDEGGASYLEVIDAGRTLAETRTAWVEVLLGYHEAMAELKRAAGGRFGNEN